MAEQLFALGDYTVRTVGEEPAPGSGPDDGVRLFVPEVMNDE